MAKKSTEELRAEAEDLGIEVDEEWSYSELLSNVKSVTADEDPPEPEPEPAAETAPGGGMRGYPFDSLGRFTG